MPEFQRPRGTRDFGPEEMARRRFVEVKMRETARLFGFGEVMTPTFESTELFVARSGEGIVDELYAFEDKGNRKISLRPELTASVMRFYVNEMQSLPKPVKIFYFGNCFRYERPQAGRYREFFQLGAELIGAPSIESDAEVIALALATLKNLGLEDVAVRIGHLGVLNKFIKDLKIPENTEKEARKLVDKRDFEVLRIILDGAQANDEATARLIELVSLEGEEANSRAREEAGSDKSFGYLTNLLDRLKAYGFENCQLDFGVARGLDYYTGMVFEIDAPSLGAEKQICGGGAYTLADLFGGQEVNSTGYAFGFDRIMLALENSGVNVPSQNLEVYILPIGDAAKTVSIGILSELRNAGISADMDLMGRNMSKAMKYANNIGAENVILIGEKELADDSVTIRNMKSGDQKKCPKNKIKDYL
ncbi:MAG: histidine--tRNA ligase [Candidatus Thermoplasmatota archaeon]|nr:histidine--tRNA ligase [Euryarchaeota archaeon]MBU4031295.1 histidine--tRNA ligase [Candidatus Thermoplasmatota archaeon]MBU4070786.1 histidine--tRNA ligase [Candidatus Thermoplasmatota archaeon]MBU4144222.1 histidine--tRNA ligase [Candidatus Thermoplasmatota archaeon]MBU4590968.1 histidine--tRNA ligase [Candidatus Thermoplasmatota archaeon]